MRFSIGYAKNFKKNLKEFQKMQKKEKPPVVLQQPVEKKVDPVRKQDLYLDLDEINEVKSPDEYVKPIRELITRPVLSEEIHEAKNLVLEEKKAQKTILESESQKLAKTTKEISELERIINSHDLRQNNQFCLNEKAALKECLDTGRNWLQAYNIWKFCIVLNS